MVNKMTGRWIYNENKDLWEYQYNGENMNLFYHLIQKLDKRVLFEDGIDEMYSLAYCLHRLHDCIVGYKALGAINELEYKELFKYINEVKNLIYRKSKICVIF